MASLSNGTFRNRTRLRTLVWLTGTGGGRCQLAGVMTGPVPPPGGRIFISYRRADAAYPAGWLFDLLAARFGADRVFKDVDSIQPGDDFAEEITAAVGSCAVLLAVIGRHWLAIAHEDGRRRLDSPADMVRLEIEAALKRGIRIIPVLVDGASIPDAAQLPASLSELAGRQAVELSPFRFSSDAGRLLTTLDEVLARDPARTAPPVPPAGTVSSSAGAEEEGRTADSASHQPTPAGSDGPEDDSPGLRDPALMLAMLRCFDVPASEGLNREQASQAFSDNGYDPRSFGGWVRRGWITRDGDRRYLTSKGRQWVAQQEPRTAENWRLILEASQALTAAGQAPFTRISVYEWIWRRHPRAVHDRPSLDPTFQGMIANATGGPRSAGGTPLRRISRGLYILDESSGPGQ